MAGWWIDKWELEISPRFDQQLITFSPSVFLSGCVRLFLYVQQCSKESIHQLVLNAENLVREEVFLQQQQFQQQKEVAVVSSSTSSRLRHHSHPQRQLSGGGCVGGPVTITPGNGGSNYHCRSDAVPLLASMKVNSTKKSASCGGSGGTARKCDHLKIKLVQVRKKLLFGAWPWTLG